LVFIFIAVISLVLFFVGVNIIPLDLLVEDVVSLNCNVGVKLFLLFLFLLRLFLLDLPGDLNDLWLAFLFLIV
jgi:hypothetical protein